MTEYIKLEIDNPFLTMNCLAGAVRDAVNQFVEKPNPEKQLMARAVEKYINYATNGNIQDRASFKEFLKTILLTEIPLSAETPANLEANKQMIDTILPFHEPARLSARDKFEILLYSFDPAMGAGYSNGYQRLKRKYDGMFGGRIGEQKPGCLSDVAIDRIYGIETPQLSFDDKVNIVVQRIYEEVYGLGCIDILAYSNINEVGVSNDGDYIYCWDGDKIHLSFLHMSQGELTVIQHRSISFDSKSGQLCAATPEVCCHRADDARVTVLQPPYSSSRCLCIRIFNQSGRSLKEILPDMQQRLLIETLVKAGAKIVLQGSLGSGKTTTMQTLLEVLSDNLHVGTVEDYFEQHNAKRYPDKRVVELQQLPDKTLLDAAMSLLRTSIDVASVGEARDGKAVFTFLQLAQAINQAAMFTCHVASPEDTVPRLKNMLLSTGIYFSEQAAVADVVNYINIIFQHENIAGQRRITKIVEIVPMVQKVSNIAVLESTDSETLEKLAFLQQIRQDTAYMYRLNPIMVYTRGEYQLVNMPSEKMLAKIWADETATNLLTRLLNIAGLERERKTGGEEHGKNYKTACPPAD